MSAPTFDYLAAIIAGHFMVPIASIGPKTTAADVDGWDSISHTMLILEIENRLDMHLDPEATIGVETVQELFDLIRQSWGRN